MNYTLHQLKVFVEIVNKESITKAAKALSLTQPAVSIQLKKLQDQFPLPLTEVIGKKLYVTGFGKEIAITAQKILDEVAIIDHKTKAYYGKLIGKLKISTVSTGKYVIPYYISDFVNQHVGIDFLIDITNKQAIIRDLEQNKTDFALVSVLPNHLALETIPLLKNSLYLVGGAIREINRKDEVLSIFENEPLLYREKGSATRNAMEAFINGRNITITKKIELTSNEALKEAVIAGLGYSIMPMIGIKSAIDLGTINVIEYPGLPIHTQWYLVWLKNKSLSPIANAFVEYLKTEKDTITKKHFGWVHP